MISAILLAYSAFHDDVHSGVSNSQIARAATCCAHFLILFPTIFNLT